MKTQLIIDRLFYNQYGQMIVSALFGLSLALIFSRVCKDNCTLYIAPNYDEISNRIFKLNDTCYKYKLVEATCNNNALEANTENFKASNKIQEPTIMNKLFA
jgi:hypothetical protein